MEGDTFLPFGSAEAEAVPPKELVFTSGHEVQTRQWLWRQSELGKITLNSNDIIFQLVGFKGPTEHKLSNAMKSVEQLIVDRFGGSFESYVVDKDTSSINF